MDCEEPLIFFKGNLIQVLRFFSIANLQMCLIAVLKLLGLRLT